MNNGAARRMGDSFVALTSKSKELATIRVADPVVRRNAKPQELCEVKEDGYPDNVRAIGTTSNSDADA